MADDRSAAADDRETPGAAAESTGIVGSAGGVGGAGRVGQPPAGSDATAAIPAADATARIRGVTDPGQQPTQRVTPWIWGARVPIAPDDVAPVRESAPPEWEQAEWGQAEWEQAEWEQPQGEPDATGDRPPLPPAVLALIVVALLAMLGTGLWLIFHRSAEAPVPVPGLPPVASAAPTPVDTATATDTAPPTHEATTEAPRPTGAPTTAPAPTQAPAPPPPPTTQAMVAVPDGLVGLTVKDAKRELAAVGLKALVTGVPKEQAVVLDTHPQSGAMVPRGSVVTLVAGLPTTSPTVKVPASE
jgi:hypothetical protein